MAKFGSNLENANGNFMLKNLQLIFSLSILFLANLIAQADEAVFSGSYLLTGNISTIDKAITSANNRLGLNVKPSWSSGNFDFRVESYTETSFHTPDKSIVNEHKLETQLNYNHAINTIFGNDIFGITGGMLYHQNDTFRDQYFWAITGLTYSQKISDNVSLSGALLAEKRNKGGRVFYDASGSVEYRLMPQLSTFLALHRYENLGEFDATPSHKLEYELGANYTINSRFFTGISYLHHTQDNDADDRFALLKLKLGVNF